MGNRRPNAGIQPNGFFFLPNGKAWHKCPAPRRFATPAYRHARWVRSRTPSRALGTRCQQVKQCAYLSHLIAWANRPTGLNAVRGGNQ